MNYSHYCIKRRVPGKLAKMFGIIIIVHPGERKLRNKRNVEKCSVAFQSNIQHPSSALMGRVNLMEIHQSFVFL